MVVKRDLVQRALYRCFGQALTDSTTLVTDCTRLLRAWMPGTADLSALAKQVEDCLLSGLYSALGERLAWKDDSGRSWRIPLSALPEAADCVMDALFLSMSATPAHYALLRDYAMQSGSVAAVHALYLTYPDLHSEQERQVQQRILKENGWLE